MNRYTWPITIVIVAIVLAGGGIGLALALHHNPAPAPAPSISGAAANSASTSSGGTATAPPTAAPSTSQASPASAFTVCTNPVGATCAGTMKTEPATILTTGDGTAYVQNLNWTGWGNPTAAATGTMEVNNCVPDCAGGTFTGYPATVTLTSLTPYSAGEMAYATITISAPTAPPPTNSYVYHHAVP